MDALHNNASHLMPASAKAQERNNLKERSYPFHISQTPRPQTHTRTIPTTPSDLSTVYPRPHIERDCHERLKLNPGPYSYSGCRSRQNWIARHRLRRMRSKIERNISRCLMIMCVAGGWDEARCEEPLLRWRRVRARASLPYCTASCYPNGYMQSRFKRQPLFCRND